MLDFVSDMPIDDRRPYCARFRDSPVRKGTSLPRASSSDTVPRTLHIVPADPDPSDPTPQTRALPYSRVGAGPPASHSFPSFRVG
jgi:hypothetical protein